MWRNHIQNLHTHNSFCDGNDTPEELVLHAMELGFEGIGLSCHSYTSFAPGGCLLLERADEYKKEIRCLKEKYRGKINVFCGLEYEMFSNCDKSGYDYLIGSSHYLKIKDEIILLDCATGQEVKNVIDTYFDGDGMKCVKAYYEGISHLHEYGDFDIVGHFDLPSKHSETCDLFDTESKEYRNVALESLYAVAEHIRIFEVNTGGISRGYKTVPYLAPFILKELKSLNCSVVISSDCHDKNYIDCHFKQSMELIKSCGFEDIMILTETGFKEIKI